jgi:hypothetical protein
MNYKIFKVKTDIQLTQQLLIKDLDVKDPGLVHSNLIKLRAWLIQEISYMMDRDFQKLLNVLYRIDINEEKVRRAFAGENPADQLADLIIEREIMKVETRKRFKP